jgi:hypothetical protein
MPDSENILCSFIIIEMTRIPLMIISEGSELKELTIDTL